MESNIKRKPGRIKNDTCIKAYQLINTMELTNEEFGLLVRKILIEDDNKETRFETINEVIKKAYLRKEEKWLKEFDEMIENKAHIISSYCTMLGQTTKSRKAFENWQDQKERELNEAEEKTAQEEDKAEEKKPSHEAPVPEKKNLGVNKGAYWLHGSDYETEEEEALLTDEIMNNYNWREDEDLLADYKSGEFFKSVKVSKISREITAYNVVNGYMKSFYGR